MSLRPCLFFVLVVGAGIRLSSGKSFLRRRDAADQTTGCREVADVIERSVDVVVIGAGMSGIKAAKTLEEHATPISYVLLEASDRVGGRMRKHTLPNGYVVEDGANWIIGGKGNPIYEMAVDLDMALYDQGSEYFDWKVYSSTTGQAYDEALVRTRESDFHEALKCVNERGWGAWCRRMLKEGDPSVRVVLDECGWNPTDALDDAIEWSYIDWGFTYPANKVSIFSYPDYSETEPFGEGSFLVSDQRGFQFIPETLAHMLLQDPKLETEVVLIEWDNLDLNLAPARVHAINRRDGSCTIYNANAVIPTVSIGVLEQRQDIFSPPLKDFASKNTFEMGSFQKIFYTFEDAFWKDDGTDHEFINVAMPREDRGKCSLWLSLDKGNESSSVSMTNATGIEHSPPQQQPLILNIPNTDGKKSPGIMFNIDSSAPIVIETLYIHTVAQHTDPPVEIEVFTKQGSYIDFETEPNPWTKVFHGSVVGLGPATLTKLDEDIFVPISIQSGAKQAVYVSIKTPMKRCSNCLLGNKVQSTNNREGDLLKVDGGIGMTDLFVSAGNKRAFTGAIVYHMGSRLKEEKEKGEEGTDEDLLASSTEILPGSRTLFCTLVTPQVEMVGEVSKEEAMSFLTPLKTIYGSDRVVPSNIYAVAQWKDSPWTFGSYANWKVGSDPSSYYELMNEPQRDMHGRSVIFLGGSAACLAHLELVQGAYYAGEMKALQVLAYLEGEKYDAWKHLCNK
mmetsp:Transcript_21321/g.50311  ORF Transcript_21321/g.50311 Transcript_21321/m.50311 type:complete len:733 (-) Transcript_21321:80-2278(-)